MSNNHPEDKATIEKLHTDVTNRINDQLLTFQDDSYALGLARGIKQGDEMRDQLVKALGLALEVADERLPVTSSLYIRDLLAKAKAVQP